MCSAHLSQFVRLQVNPDGYRDSEKLLEILRDAASAQSRSTIHWIVAERSKGARSRSNTIIGLAPDRALEHQKGVP